MRTYLRVANVFEDRIDISDVLSMNFSPAEFSTFELKYGDILLNEGQSLELVGRPAMYRDEVPGACFQNTLIRFKPLHGLEARYSLAVFRAYLHSKRFQKAARWTVNIAHLGAQRLSKIEFPLPPSAEQFRIITEIDRRMSVIDEVERDIRLDVARAKSLRQSILQRAFEGKLAPQDPNDEPASVLLERIRGRANPSSVPQVRGPKGSGRKSLRPKETANV
jgi:type I restriction enzyme S subunit